MKTSASILSAVLFSGAFAAPAAEPINHLTARADNKCEATDVGSIYFDWELTVNTERDNQATGCGRGFLDNYRGRCGSVENWECEAIEPGKAIHMTFRTSGFCTMFDITEATKAGSGGVVVDCAVAKKKRDVESPAEAIEEKRDAAPAIVEKKSAPVVAQPLEARADNSCNCKVTDIAYRWNVVINTSEDNQATGCGRGFLDNYRGRCGAIEQWECAATEPGKTITMDFATTIFCTPFDITEATKAASKGVQVDCFCEDA